MKNMKHISGNDIPALPDGAFDKDSAWFVPPKLREHYPAVEPRRDATAYLDSARQLLADDYVSRELGAYEPLASWNRDDPAERARVRRNDERHAANRAYRERLTLKEIAPYAEHLVRLEAAGEAAQAATNHRAHLAQLKRSYLCPVCEVQANGSNGRVQTRNFPVKTEPLLSCEACYLVAQHVLTEQLAAEADRASKLRAHFSEPGA